MNHMSNLFDF